jgi:hypothetical protein
MSVTPILKRRETPTFSLCHSTARLKNDGWRPAAQEWFDKCDDPSRVEHILVTDDPSFTTAPVFTHTIFGVNRGRKCAVDGWNKSAELSTGKFLITVADDWFPCEHWDTELLKVIPDLEGEYMLEVDTGGNPGLLTFSMLTRKYYRRYGYLFYPEYLGMYADNEVTDVARRDGVVVDAKHLFFEHKHPLYGHGEMDEVHKHQHRSEAFAVGEEIYMRRRKLLGFDKEYIAPRRYTVAVCIPGNSWDMEWQGNFIQLMSYLKDNANVLPVLSYAPNPHITRTSMVDHILEKIDPLPDFVLWIDRDNLVAPLHFAQLFESIEKSKADLVAGWCWWGTGRNVSCGSFDAQGNRHWWSGAQLMSGPDYLKPVEFTGFPCLLMRGETLKKIGLRPFVPIVDSKAPWGFWPEDLSFSIRAQAANLKMFVDRRVAVVHQKIQPLEEAVAEVQVA